MACDTCPIPQRGQCQGHAGCGPAGGMLVLRWEAPPCWPVRHNARRALAMLRGGARAVLLARTDCNLLLLPHAQVA